MWQIWSIYTNRLQVEITMRYKIYMSVYGDERTIKTLENELNDDDSSVKCHEKVKAAVSVTGKAAPWSYSTNRCSLQSEDLDKGITDFLLDHRDLMNVIKNHPLRDQMYVSVVIIMQYDSQESPQSIYLSSGTIALLKEIDASFEIDAVQVMQ